MQDSITREVMHFRNKTNNSIVLHVNISGNLTLTFDEENTFFEYNATPTTPNAIVSSKMVYQSSSEASSNTNSFVALEGTDTSNKYKVRQQFAKKPAKDPYGHFKPMMIIPSEEGLVSQYLRVTGFLEKAKEYNRSLVLFPFVSHHYSDIAHSTVTTGGRIHLCDIFYFPYNLVTCYNAGKNPATISNVLAQHKCSPYQFNDWMKSHPGHFGLESFEGLSSQPFDFATSECAIIGTQGGPKKWTVEIRFTYKYNELLKIALESLKRIRIERASVTFAQASNISTREKESSTWPGIVHETENISSAYSKSYRRRLYSWLNISSLRGKSIHLRGKKLQLGESENSDVERIHPIAGNDSTETHSSQQLSSAFTAGSVDENMTTNTITYQYYLNLTSSKAKDPKHTLGHDILLHSVLSNGEKLYNEMVEPGGQNVDFGTEVGNHSSGLSYTHFISEHKNQSGLHRLHYRDHDSIVLRSFDAHFNMSDLPPSEEEFLASSKEAPQFPYEVSDKLNGRSHEHDIISDIMDGSLQHGVLHNESRVVEKSSLMRRHNTTGNSSKKSSFADIHPKLKYMSGNQVHESKFNFSADDTFPIGSTIEKINFIVAHWRRGDQLTSSLRCRNGLDNSVNCGSVQNFMKEMNNSIRNITKYNQRFEFPIVYICTNEESPNSIFELKRNNFVLYHDLVNYASNEAKAHKLASLNSLERFILESQLMIYSTHFIYFGITSIHPFVKHGRIQLQERLKKLLKIKSEK